MWPFTDIYDHVAEKISTHTSRVGCDLLIFNFLQFFKISTHTSRVGCDITQNLRQSQTKFLLTHPVWDVTELSQSSQPINYISTHTSRVGCDINKMFEKGRITDFYSHIPCGMWRAERGQAGGIWGFLLTHPVWDVTQKILPPRRVLKFLLTHPVWDVTPSNAYGLGRGRHFYSHIPCGMWHHLGNR